MEKSVTKLELITRFITNRDRFMAALGKLTAAQIAQPHTIGIWSIKDLIAHLIAHERRALSEIEYARRGEKLYIDFANDDIYNANAVEEFRTMAVEAVITAWNHSFGAIVATVAVMAESDFDPEGNLVKMLEDTIDGTLANNSYLHYQEHFPALENAIYVFHADHL